MMHQQVKERVVGAVVLVVAAAIFIPMILAGAPQQRAGADARAAAQRGADKGSVRTSTAQTGSASNVSGFSSRIVPVDEASSARQAPPAVATDNAREAGEATPDTPSVVPLVRPVQVPPVQLSAAAKSAVNLPEVRKAIAAPVTPELNDGWVVQLGSFANVRNANALRDRLSSKGYKAFARTTGTGAEAVTRVYVGPETTRERAQARVAILLSETQLQGLVMGYPK